jgi:hypothetical protein
MSFPRVVSGRISRAFLGGALVVACSDSTQPTQPTAKRVIVPSSKAAGDVVAGTEAPSGTFFACYVPTKGTIYLIKTSDTPSQCDKKDVEFSWTTDQGPTPIRGIEFHSGGATLPSDGRYLVLCAAGKSMMNFGWEIPGNSLATASQIRASRPTLSGGQMGWAFEAAPGTAYTFYWSCADAAPVTHAP